MSMFDGGIAIADLGRPRDRLNWDMVLPIDAGLGNDFTLLERYAEGGAGFVSLTMAGDDCLTAEAMHRIARARATILAAPSRYRFVETTEDIRIARQEGKLAVGLHLEGTRVLERDLELIECFYKLGIRHSILAFNKSNSCGGGCAERNDGGLTRFGELVVAEMGRVGMLLDLSHTGYRTTMEAMERSTSPVIFSHSNVNALQPHFRNLRDDQMLACAALGGVIGISGSSIYLGPGGATAEAILRHIDYMVDLVGAEHVGIGLDYVDDVDLVKRWMLSRPDEWPLAPGEIPDPSYAGPEIFPELADLMQKQGYPDQDIDGVLGLNFMRVCERVWK